MRRKILILLFAIAITLFPRTQHDKLIAAPSNKIILNGKASWYSRHDPGINKRTANNEIFDDTEMTCAMWGVPFNQMLRITNLENGKSIIVRVNDRGPHYRFVKQGRLVDLTQAAFSRISSRKKGLINIELEFL